MLSHTHKQRSKGGNGNIAQYGNGVGAEFLGTSGASLGDTFPTGGNKGHHEFCPPSLVVKIYKRTK